MPDMYFDVDTAITECPVNLLPLLDATDFKTIEDAVAYNAAGMALYWHFCTSAGAYTVTAVTPTTAGVYDWIDQGTSGIYTIEIPASGGGSINNDTEGYGWFTGMATGVLPWRGPVIGFRAAAINDALMDGGDNLDVNSVQFAGQTISAAAGVTLPSSVASPTNITAATGVVLSGVTHTGAVIPTVTTLTGHTAQTGDSFARLGAPGGASIAADLLAIDNFVDGLEASLAAGVTVSTNNDKTGYSLTATTGLGNQTANITGTITAVTTVNGLAANVITAAATAADFTTEIQAGLATAAALSVVGSYIDDEIADIQARLPAALVGGRMASTIEAVSNDVGAATKLKRVLLSNVIGTVGAASSTTSIVTSALNPAAAVADQYKGLILKFDDATTTAALRGQGTDITASTAGGVLTVTALTTAPVNGDTFTVS